MMAGLFLIHFISLLFILWQKRNTAFVIMIFALILSFLMLLHHSTDLLNIRL